MVPKTFGGKVKENLHKMCHQKIHATFSERELLNTYHTFEAMLAHDEIKKFVKWIAKKAVDYYSKNDDTSGRKKKRK